MLDSIINESQQKHGVGDKAGNILSSLLGLITDQSRGGFAGFLDRFRQIGLGGAADSWVGNVANVSLSNEQVDSALGIETTGEIARQSGVDEETAKAVLGTMIPRVVDLLTPHGVVPTEHDLLSKVGGFLSGVGGSTVSTTGVMASDSVDRFGTAAAENFSRHTQTVVSDEELSDDSPLKWIIPLVIVFLLIAAGWAFCSKPAAPNASMRSVNIACV